MEYQAGQGLQTLTLHRPGLWIKKTHNDGKDNATMKAILYITIIYIRNVTIQLKYKDMLQYSTTTL